MPILDVNTLIGTWPHFEADLTLETLAASMQARQIGLSLVTHTAAIFYDTASGNDQAVAACAPNMPIRPVAVINPLTYPACTQEIKQRLGQGVRVFRLCPAAHGYPFAGNVGPLREVLAALEGAALVLVDLVDLPQPAIGSDLLELLPCPTALTVDARGLGLTLHAARHSTHVYLETSRLTAGGALEAAIAGMGAERVLFGSGSPLRAIGSAVMSVQFADIPDADRHAVFEGNLRRLLN